MRRKTTVRLVAFALLSVISMPALAAGVLFSTASPAAIDGPDGPGTTQFTDGDIVQMNVDTGVGTIAVLADTINESGLPDLNALYMTSSGTFLFSTQSGAAGYDFDDDEIVEYDPLTDTLSLFYDFGDVMTSNADVDIDGFHILADGRYAISNTSDFTLDSQNFTNGDIVVFDPVTLTATLLFSETLFTGDDDIWVRSVSIRGNGNLVLSAFNETTGGSMMLGGVTFGRGDLVEYDLLTGTASLFSSAAVFGGATEDIDAVHAVPLPAGVWLLASALLTLSRRRLRA